DLDVCLLAPAVTERGAQIIGLRRVGKALRQAKGGTYDIQPRFRAAMCLGIESD
ncbi:unnamed protein product, partial [Effrenium voratum]